MRKVRARATFGFFFPSGSSSSAVRIGVDIRKAFGSGTSNVWSTVPTRPVVVSSTSSRTCQTPGGRCHCRARITGTPGVTSGEPSNWSRTGGPAVAGPRLRDELEEPLALLARRRDDLGREHRRHLALPVCARRRASPSAPAGRWCRRASAWPRGRAPARAASALRASDFGASGSGDEVPAPGDAPSAVAASRAPSPCARPCPARPAGSRGGSRPPTRAATRRSAFSASVGPNACPPVTRAMPSVSIGVSARAVPGMTLGRAALPVGVAASAARSRGRAGRGSGWRRGPGARRRSPRGSPASRQEQEALGDEHERLVPAQRRPASSSACRRPPSVIPVRRFTRRDALLRR